MNEQDASAPPTVPPADTPAATSEREFFDRLVSEQGAFDPFTEQGWQTLAKAFRQLVRANRTGSLLDIGCGTGSSLQVYEGCFAEYAGLDLSPVSVAVAQSRFPQHQWRAGDACALPFADGRFDTVAFSSVLHHLPNMRPALQEAYRVLKPGGMVFAFDPNLLHPAMAMLRHPKSPLYLREGVSPNERPLLPRELREAFQAAGFRDIRQRAQSAIGYRHAAPRGVNALLSTFNLVDRVWQWVGLGRWLGTFVLTSAAR